MQCGSVKIRKHLSEIRHDLFLVVSFYSHKYRCFDIYFQTYDAKTEFIGASIAINIIALPPLLYIVITGLNIFKLNYTSFSWGIYLI